MPARDSAPMVKRTRGLARAFEILDYLRRRRRAANANEIAAQLGAPRSSVYELVGLLVGQGLLEPVDAEGRVYLGRQLYFLGQAYEAHYDFTRECDRVLASLAAETRETAQFCMLDGDKYTVVRMREGARPFRISSDVGQPVPIPWTASGRLLVADLADPDILGLIPGEDFRLPDGSWLEPRAFLAQVEAARAAGVFTFDSVVDSFTSCFAAAVPGLGRSCVATLCLVAPRADAVRNRDRYLASLRAGAAALGHRPGPAGPGG